MTGIAITYDEPMFPVVTFIWNGKRVKQSTRRPDDLETAKSIAKDLTQLAETQLNIKPRIRENSLHIYNAEFSQYHMPFLWITVDPVFKQWKHGDEVWHIEAQEIG
jgi:hypothetical protein